MSVVVFVVVVAAVVVVVVTVVLAEYAERELVVVVGCHLPCQSRTG